MQSPSLSTWIIQNLNGLILPVTSIDRAIVLPHSRNGDLRNLLSKRNFMIKQRTEFRSLKYYIILFLQKQTEQ